MSEEITQIRIGNSTVGIMGLNGIFEQIHSLELKDPKEIQQKLIELAKLQNYIPSSAEEKYQQALWREYRRSLGEQVEEETTSDLVIRVLGPGCPACEKLMEDVKETLAELGLAADLMHVRDPKEIGRYGMVGTPGLVINKKIKCSGKSPRRKQLIQWIQEAAKN